MKTRIKVVTHNGFEYFYPQYRCYGFWRDILVAPLDELSLAKVVIKDKIRNGKEKIKYIQYPIPTPEPEHFQDEKPKLDKDGLLLQSISQPTTSR